MGNLGWLPLALACEAEAVPKGGACDAPAPARISLVFSVRMRIDGKAANTADHYPFARLPSFFLCSRLSRGCRVPSLALVASRRWDKLGEETHRSFCMSILECSIRTWDTGFFVITMLWQGLLIETVWKGTTRCIAIKTTHRKQLARELPGDARLFNQTVQLALEAFPRFRSTQLVRGCE